MKNSNSVFLIEKIESKIYFIRGQNVMLDADLAVLYEVETKRLKEQVKRNIERFPGDFMFELSKRELENWRSHIATSNPKAKKRIYVCGCSHTFGVGLNLEETWPYQFKKLFVQKGKATPEDTG